MLYVDCENGAPKIMQLILRAQLRKKRSEWTDEDAGAARRALADAGGRLWIKDLSAFDATPGSIEGMIRGLERSEGVKFDAVILDHLEHLSPDKGDRRGDEMRHVYGRVARQMRRVIRRLDTRLVTAWQSNRSGVGADTMTEEHIAESYDVFKHADTWITFNRSSTEKRNHCMRLGILKKRVAGEGAEVVTVYCDWARMIMEDNVRGDRDAIHTAGEKAAVDVLEGGGTGAAGADTGKAGVRGRPGLSADGADPDVRAQAGA